MPKAWTSCAQATSLQFLVQYTPCLLKLVLNFCKRDVVVREVPIFKFRRGNAAQGRTFQLNSILYPKIQHPSPILHRSLTKPQVSWKHPDRSYYLAREFWNFSHRWHWTQRCILGGGHYVVLKVLRLFWKCRNHGAYSRLIEVRRIHAYWIA